MKLQIADKTYYLDFIHEPWKTHKHGQGETWCSLREDAKAQPVVNGIAYCGKKDNYNKRKGRKISFGWMLEELSLDRATRAKCWEQYFEQLPGDRV